MKFSIRTRILLSVELTILLVLGVSTSVYISIDRFKLKAKQEKDS